MFTRRTLFILGAGSSYEAGLPTGVGLARIIREKMDFASSTGSSQSEKATTTYMLILEKRIDKTVMPFGKQSTGSKLVSALRSPLTIF